MIGFKSVFLEKFEDDIRAGNIRKVCDLGSGLSKSFLPLLEKYPDLEYLGIEPSAKHAKEAREILSKYRKAKVINKDAYDEAEGWGTYDLVISLSVLEHVKQLERFLRNSVRAARPGGRIVHRWDLGHALYPSSVKERFQVWLGDNLPNALPEHKFVSTLLPGEVEKIMKNAGARIEGVTYHQMPNHKDFLKRFLPDTSEKEVLVRRLIEWEFDASEYLKGLSEIERCKYFPAVALWSRKGV